MKGRSGVNAAPGVFATAGGGGCGPAAAARESDDRAQGATAAQEAAATSDSAAPTATAAAAHSEPPALRRAGPTRSRHGDRWLRIGCGGALRAGRLPRGRRLREQERRRPASLAAATNGSESAVANNVSAGESESRARLDDVRAYHGTTPRRPSQAGQIESRPSGSGWPRRLAETPARRRRRRLRRRR